MPFLEPGGDALRIARGGVDEEVVFAHAHEDTIVDDDTVLVEHQPVAHTPGLQGQHIVDIDAVEKPCRIRSPDLDLAER